MPESLASQKQQLYIEQLAIDLGLTRIQRNDRIRSIIGIEVKFLDELTSSEASRVINHFRDVKYGHA